MHSFLLWNFNLLSYENDIFLQHCIALSDCAMTMLPFLRKYIFHMLLLLKQVILPAKSFSFSPTGHLQSSFCYKNQIESALCSERKHHKHIRRGTMESVLGKLVQYLCLVDKEYIRIMEIL